MDHSEVEHDVQQAVELVEQQYLDSLPDHDFSGESKVWTSKLDALQRNQSTSSRSTPSASGHDSAEALVYCFRPPLTSREHATWSPHHQQFRVNHKWPVNAGGKCQYVDGGVCNRPGLKSIQVKLAADIMHDCAIFDKYQGFCADHLINGEVRCSALCKDKTRLCRHVISEEKPTCLYHALGHDYQCQATCADGSPCLLPRQERSDKCDNHQRQVLIKTKALESKGDLKAIPTFDAATEESQKDSKRSDSKVSQRQQVTDAISPFSEAAKENKGDSKRIGKVAQRSQVTDAVSPFSEAAKENKGDSKRIGKVAQRSQVTDAVSPFSEAAKENNQRQQVTDAALLVVPGLIVVLECEPGGFYLLQQDTVAVDEEVDKAIRSIKKRHPPLRIVDFYPNGDSVDLTVLTVLYAARYGQDCVRGGPWLHLSEDTSKPDEADLIQAESMSWFAAAPHVQQVVQQMAQQVTTETQAAGVTSRLSSHVASVSSSLGFIARAITM
jgi:hypothetical protein